MNNIRGLFTEVTEYFRLTQEDERDLLATDNIKEFWVTSVPGIRFRFELYEDEDYIKFLILPFGYEDITLFTFRIDMDHWSGEHMNRAIAGAMKAIREMYRIYARQE